MSSPALIVGGVEGSSSGSGKAAVTPTKKVSAGLQLGIGTRTRPVAIVRHVELPVAAGVKSGSKWVSNEINKYGKYRPAACTSCLKAMGNFNKSFITGRGAKAFNEYFSCLTFAAYGVSGTQCARCVGNSEGRDCMDPPADLTSNVKELIKLAPEYNRLLQANDQQRYVTWSDDDKASIDNIVLKAKQLGGALEGLKKLKPEQFTPSKRSAAVAFADDEKITALGQSSTDIRSDIRAVTTAVGSLNTSIRHVQRSLADIERHQAVSRARQMWLMGAVKRLAESEEVTLEDFDVDLVDGTLSDYEGEAAEASDD